MAMAGEAPEAVTLLPSEVVMVVVWDDDGEGDG